MSAQVDIGCEVSPARQDSAIRRWKPPWFLINFARSLLNLGSVSLVLLKKTYTPFILEKDPQFVFLILMELFLILAPFSLAFLILLKFLMILATPFANTVLALEVSKRVV